VRNANYFGGRTNLDAVDFLTIPESQARVSALLADQIDLIYFTNVDFASARVISQSSNCRVLEQPASDWRPLVMRTDRAPFRDIRVREAFKIAVDPKVLIRVVAQGHGTIAANNPVALDDQYRLRLKHIHDPEKARSLLRAAGRSGVRVTLKSSSADPAFTPLAVAFKSEAAKAGIRVDIEQVPPDQYWSTTWLKAPFCFSSWGGGRPADQLLNEIFRAGAPYNESYWQSTRFGKVLDQARRTLDVKKRTELYQEAQRLLVKGSGDIVPFFSNTLRGMNKRVRNYREQGFELDWLRLAIS
jgi:peptide/nickel transport system substrate-binding protein